VAASAVNVSAGIHLKSEAGYGQDDRAIEGGGGSGAVKGENVLVCGLKGCYWWRTV
jgi:hypothetical protein